MVRKTLGGVKALEMLPYLDLNYIFKLTWQRLVFILDLYNLTLEWYIASYWLILRAHFITRVLMSLNVAPFSLTSLC